MTDKKWPGPAGALSAAAQRFIDEKNVSRNKKAADSSWQAEAWAHFKVTPEVRYAATYMGNVMSGARLFAGRRLPDGTVEEAPENSRAAELVRSIAGGPDGQSEILRAYGIHLTVAGEGWTVILPNPDAESFADDDWRVLSTQEVKVKSGVLTAEINGEEVEIPGADAETYSPTDPAAIRIWDPAPWRFIEADSPVRSSLVLLEELQLLNAAVAAIARSRITGRGVIFVPQGTRFPSAPGQDDAADDLLQLFTEVASTAIREPESAAATVPIILEVPGDLLGQIQQMTFESDFDELALKLRDECIRRFATGLDVPAEILLGQESLNHWAVWAVTAEAIRLGAEPRLRLVCHAYTDNYLRPILEGEGDPQAREWMVWYDTSGMRTSSNKGATALEAYQLGLISAEAARRETGFEESDAPDAVPAQRRSEEDAESEVEENVSEDPALDDLPVDQTDGVPDTLPASAAAGDRALLVEALDGLMWSAMVQVGTRLLRTPACPRSARGLAARELDLSAVHTLYPVTRPEDVDAWKLLDRAWTRVPELARRHRVDAEGLTRVLDGYARVLIDARRAYDRADLPRLIRQHASALGLVL